MASDSKSPSVPAAAKALYHSTYNQDFKQALQFGDLPVPEPQAGQVIVKVIAAALNPVDWKISAGYLSKVFPMQFPHIIGYDGAGVVAKLGPGVSKVNVGDEVYFDSGSIGTFAEYVIAKEIQLAPKPASLSWEQTAGVPVAFMTAYQMLHRQALPAGAKVLVLGATSAVGIAAVQLAKHLGYWVAATSSGAKADFARKLGVDELVDYRTKKFHEELKAHQFDAVMDTVAEPGSYELSLPLIKKGGIFVSTGTHGEKSTADVNYTMIICDNDKGSEQLPIFNELFNKGKLQTFVDKVYSWDLPSLLDMYAYSISGRATGKLVVRIA